MVTIRISFFFVNIFIYLLDMSIHYVLHVSGQETNCSSYLGPINCTQVARLDDKALLPVALS